MHTVNQEWVIPISTGYKRIFFIYVLTLKKLYLERNWNRKIYYLIKKVNW